jgi:hypothetical protein
VPEVADAEVAEKRRHPVEPAVTAEEATVGESAAPGFANEGGADEVRGLVRRDAEEDLLDDILHQRRWRHGGAMALVAKRGRRVSGFGS